MSQPTRIFFVTHYAGLYGANRSLIDLVGGLVKHHNVKPFIYVGARKKGDDPRLLASKLTSMKIEFHIGYFPILFSNNTFFEKVKGLIKLPLAIIYYKNVRNICNQFSPDFIYINSSLITFGSLLKFKTNRKLIWHIREFGVEDYNLEFVLGKKHLVRKIKKADQVIFISKTIQTSYYKSNRYNGVVLHDGIIHSVSNMPKPISRSKEDCFTFAIVGIIQPQKGQLFALEAFVDIAATVKNIKLQIIGGIRDNSYYSSIISHIERKGLESKVEIKGFQENIDNIYKDVNCVLVCSTNEGLGRVAIEAMGRGIPVIASNQGGPSEIINSGENGFLYFPGSKTDLIDKMNILMKDRIQYQKISTNGHIHAQNFIVKNYCHELYRSIINA